MLTYTDGKSLYDVTLNQMESFRLMATVQRHTIICVYLMCGRNCINILFWNNNAVSLKRAFMEDELFNFDVFSHSPFLRIVTSNIYRYEQGNPTSLLTTNDKEKILHQLKWLLFVVDKMNNYLQEDNGVIANAAKRNINTFLKAYYNKMLKACLTEMNGKTVSEICSKICRIK